MSSLKQVYYKVLISLYSYMGSHIDLVYTNSTWTNNHISEIWKLAKKIEILYPPCNISENLKFDAKNRQNKMISFAQFRPEKKHESQIEIF